MKITGKVGTRDLTSQSATVLVAEDDSRSRAALTALLEHHGYCVIAAEDGQRALEVLLGDDPPQIALLDWEMPHLDGLHICRALRSLSSRPYTYVIMVTARDQPEDILSAFDWGVDDFLSKPTDGAHLLARLRCGERVLDLERRCARRISDLETALGEVRKLKQLLPICMYCKKVRDDRDYWQEVDSYFSSHAGTLFSHGICPDCAQEPFSCK